MGFNKARGFNTSTKITTVPVAVVLPPVPTGVYITGEAGEFFINETDGSRLVVE